MKHVVPISSVRFFLAAWVFLSHFPYPILSQHQSNPALWILRSVLKNSFNGPAAVVTFFVISGFCIHFPNRQGKEIPSWAAYYARRYVRILIPMAVAIALAMPLRLQLGFYLNFVLWSLICEEIYYLIYPALLNLQRRLGWKTLSVLAWIASLCVLASKPSAKEYHNFGPALTWLFGLPCWLLGVWMAEGFDKCSLKSVGDIEIWLWRCGIWVLSVSLAALRFHTIIGFPWTLNFFAIAAALWLEHEISYYRGRGPNHVVEKLGNASYSVYLTHMHGATMAAWIVLAPSVQFWWLNVFITFAFSTTFYFLVERPSHHLARKVSRGVAERAKAVLDGTQATIRKDTLQIEN